MALGVDSTSDRKGYQESSCEVKRWRRVRVTTSLPYVSRLSGHCGTLIISLISRPVMTIALFLTLRYLFKDGFSYPQFKWFWAITEYEWWIGTGVGGTGSGIYFVEPLGNNKENICQNNLPSGRELNQKTTRFEVLLRITKPGQWMQSTLSNWPSNSVAYSIVWYIIRFCNRNLSPWSRDWSQDLHRFQRASP
jgi:hypothetical protein